MLIEIEGLLFRGPRVNEPVEIWHYTRKEWMPYLLGKLGSPQPFGRQIGEDRAEALKVDKVDAKHYPYYDFPPWL